MSKIQLHNIRYIESAGTFEARVDVKRGDATFRYPCSITGPSTMNIADVSYSLTQQALRMSDTNIHLRARF